MWEVRCSRSRHGRAETKLAGVCVEKRINETDTLSVTVTCFLILSASYAYIYQHYCKLSKSAQFVRSSAFLTVKL